MSTARWERRLYVPVQLQAPAAENCPAGQLEQVAGHALPANCPAGQADRGRNGAGAGVKEHGARGTGHGAGGAGKGGSGERLIVVMRVVRSVTGAVGARRAVRAAARASRVAAGACDASRTAARLCQPAEKLRTRTTVEPGLGCGIGTRSRVLRTARVPQKKSNGPARRGASASISATRISATAGVAPHDRAIVREILIIFLLLFAYFSLAHTVRDRACARRRTTVSCGLRGVGDGERGPGLGDDGGLSDENGRGRGDLDAGARFFNGGIG